MSRRGGSRRTASRSSAAIATKSMAPFRRPAARPANDSFDLARVDRLHRCRDRAVIAAAAGGRPDFGAAAIMENHPALAADPGGEAQFLFGDGDLISLERNGLFGSHGLPLGALSSW